MKGKGEGRVRREKEVKEREWRSDGKEGMIGGEERERKVKEGMEV